MVKVPISSLLVTTNFSLGNIIELSNFFIALALLEKESEREKRGNLGVVAAWQKPT